MLKEFENIALDNTSGATELVHRLIALCEVCAIGYRFDELNKGFVSLESAQRSMPSFHAVLHILKSEFLPKLKEGEETAEAISYLSSLEKILNESGEAIALRFAESFSQPQRITTFSRSSTVLRGLRHLHEQGQVDHVRVLESRPMNEGMMSIRDLDRVGISATLLIDAALQDALQMSDCAIAGADSVSADGFVLNKTGTWALAVGCKELGIPFYVLCDSLKFSPQLREAVFVEDKPAEEVLTRSREDHFHIFNRYFEWTPVEYVTEFITEKGSFRPDQLSELAMESSGA